MKLVRFELKKILTNKRIFWAFCILLFANIFLLYLVNPNRIPASAYRVLNADIRELTLKQKGEWIAEQLEEAKINYLVDFIVQEEVSSGRRLDSYRELYKKEIEKYLNDPTPLRYTKDPVAEYDFLSGIFEEYSIVSNHTAYLDAINSRIQTLSSVSIFQEDTTGFDLASLRATAQAYSNVRDIEIDFQPQKGLQTALDFQLTDILLIAIILYLSSQSIYEEQRGGLLCLTSLTVNGKFKSAVAKICALLFVDMLVVLSFYLSNLLFCHLRYGIGNLFVSIQSYAFLADSVLNISVFGYFFLYILLKWLVIASISLMVSIASLCLANPWSGSLFIVLFLGINSILRIAFTATSRWAFIKYASCISLLDTNEAIGEYFNINFNSLPIERRKYEIIVAIILFAGISGFFLRVYASNLLTKKGTHIVVATRLRVQLSTVQKAEQYKSFLVNKKIVIVIIYFIVQFALYQNAAPYISPLEKRTRSYLEELSGKYTQEKYEWLKEKSEDFIPLYELDSKVQYGGINVQDYQMMKAFYSDLELDYSAFNNVLRVVNYTNENPGAYIISATGYYELFDINEKTDLRDLLFILMAMIFCISDAVAYDKSSDMFQLILSTPKGGLFTLRAKLIVCAKFAIIFSVMSFISRVLIVNKYYGLDGLLYPANSLPFFEQVSPMLPIAVIALLMLFVRFISAYIVGLFVMTLSCVTGKTISTISASAVIFLFPLLASMFFFEQFKYIGVYPILHSIPLLAKGNSIQIIANIILLAIYSALCYTILKEHYDL